MFLKALREPLLQFLGIGLLLFGLYGAVSGNRWRDDRRIVVDESTLASIVGGFQALWQRPPSPEEIRGLVDTYISEEARYREGISLGLDKDDPVIRRRVLQKLDVISEESNRRTPPTEAQLQTFLETNAGRYAHPGTLTFEQVLFDPSRHGDRTAALLGAALAQLRAGGKPARLGDPTLLPAQVSQTVDLVARDFGEEFTHALDGLPVGTWEGPIRSAFGLHLVRIGNRTPARPATLEEARAAVTRDYESEQRQQAAQQYERRLLENYQVVIEARLPGVTMGESP